MKWIVALAALLCAAPATPQHNTATSSVFPPPRFHAGQIAIPVFYMNDPADGCGAAPPGYRILGCVRTLANGLTVMVLPNPCNPAFMGERYAHIACHETAHAKGWTRMHEE